MARLSNRLSNRLSMKKTAAVAILAVVAAGCSNSNSNSTKDSATASTDQTKVTAPDMAKLSAFTGQKPAWAPCENFPVPTAQCTKVKVPLDYAKPDGESMEIVVNRIPATGGAKKGSLVFNPGGPGGSGVNASVRLAKEATAVAADYDIIGFDPRGVARSSQIHCLDNAAHETYYASNSASKENRDTWHKATKGMADACKANAGNLLPHIGTENVARDIEVIRNVLGEEKINYLGISYGTLLGQYYAEQFPGRINRMNLDSNLAAEVTLPEFIEQTATARQKSFDAFLDYCVAKNPCPLGSSKTDITEKVLKLATDLDVKPAPVALAPGRPVTGSDLRSAMGLGLSQRDGWPAIIPMMQAAANGDFKDVRGTADNAHARKPDGTFTGGDEINIAGFCTFATDVDRSHQAQDDAIAKATKASPLFGPIDTYRPCADWPVKSAATAHTIKTKDTAPVLVSNNVLDSLTPLVWAEDVARNLSGSTLVTNSAPVHGMFDNGPCTMKIFTDYFNDGTVPPAGTKCNDSTL